MGKEGEGREEERRGEERRKNTKSELEVEHFILLFPCCKQD